MTETSECPDEPPSAPLAVLQATAKEHRMKETCLRRQAGNLAAQAAARGAAAQEFETAAELLKIALSKED